MIMIIESYNGNIKIKTLTYLLFMLLLFIIIIYLLMFREKKYYYTPNRKIIFANNY